MRRSMFIVALFASVLFCVITITACSEEVDEPVPADDSGGACP